MVSRVVIDSTREIEDMSATRKYDQFVTPSCIASPVVTTMLLGDRQDRPSGGQHLHRRASSTSAMSCVHPRRYTAGIRSSGSAHVNDIRPYSIATGGLKVATRRVTVWDD